MTLILTHKIRIVPIKAQETFFKKACGTARVAYNWGLGKWGELYRAGEKTNVLAIKKEFNRAKKDLFPWMKETHKDANQQPFTNLGTAFENFFKKRSRFPKFKKKGVRDSFYISNDKFSIEGKKIRIPKLGWVKLREELRFKGKINSAVVSRIADKWFVAVSVSFNEVPAIHENQGVVGVDLGIKTLAVLSDGQLFENPKAFYKNEEKLKRLQRWLSRKQKGSSNRFKARLKVARQHYKTKCLRQDVAHKLTTYSAKNFCKIILEDLNVSGMLKNHSLAKAISDSFFYEIRRQLEYKSNIYGSKIIFADRFFPSSKKCSGCGTVKKSLSLSERNYSCEVCGLKIDRDLNAALNLKQLGAACPEVTPVDKESLGALDETGIITGTSDHV